MGCVPEFLLHFLYFIYALSTLFQNRFRQKSKIIYILKMTITINQKKVVFFMATAKRIVGIIILVIGVIMIILYGFITYGFATQGWGLAPGGILLTIVGVIVTIIGIGLLAGKKPIRNQVEPLTE